MIATRSDQIREQVAQIPWSIFISKNYQNDISKWPDIKMTTKDSKLVRCYSVSKTSVSFRYQLKRLCDVLNWSVSFRSQLVRRYDVSNWSVLFRHQWDVTKTSQIGLANLCTSWISLRHQLVRCYNVSKTSVSFRYQLWCLCDLLSGSVSLRYHLLRRCNVSNWLVLFTDQWEVTKMSQIGQSHWRISWEVAMAS